MKTAKFLTLLVFSAAFALVARAADEVKTITGDAMCAKCELKLQANCQTVIKVKDGASTVMYYVAPNSVGKAFHSTVCDAPAAVTATGTVATVDGKLVLTASSIELKK